MVTSATPSIFRSPGIEVSAPLVTGHRFAESSPGRNRPLRYAGSPSPPAAPPPSRRNRRSSSNSDGLTDNGFAARACSASSFATQFRNVVSFTPSRRATSARDSLLASAICTAACPELIRIPPRTPHIGTPSSGPRPESGVHQSGPSTVWSAGSRGTVRRRSSATVAASMPAVTERPVWVIRRGRLVRCGAPPRQAFCCALISARALARPCSRISSANWRSARARESCRVPTIIVKSASA
jgi:hypothetical protein